MKLFNKKEKLILKSEQQKDDLIEKLESAHITYNLREKEDSIPSNRITYIVSVNAADMKKIV